MVLALGACSHPRTNPLDRDSDGGCVLGTVCSGNCVDLEVDSANCGACGKSCGEEGTRGGRHYCEAGACVSCPDGGTCGGRRWRLDPFGETVTDLYTGIIWERGSSLPVRFSDGQNYCKNLHLDRATYGYNGQWVLPSIFLGFRSSLSDDGRCLFDDSVFPGCDRSVWTQEGYLTLDFLDGGSPIGPSGGQPSRFGVASTRCVYSR